MGFMDKLRSAIRKIKGKLIAYGILLLVILLWLGIPYAVAVVDAHLATGITFSQDLMNGDLWSTFMTSMGSGLTAPWTKIPYIFKADYIGFFLQELKMFILFATFFALIGIIKAFPKHEYQDIENGSSD